MIEQYTFHYKVSGADCDWHKGTVAIDVPEEHADEIVPKILKAIRMDRP